MCNCHVFQLGKYDYGAALYAREKTLAKGGELPTSTLLSAEALDEFTHSVKAITCLQISDNNYTSMWSTLYSGDGTIIWDSETLDDVGHNMVEFTPQADELEAIQAAMAQGDAFNMRKTREDGDQVSCFYSPLQVGGETWWSMTGVKYIKRKGDFYAFFN